MSFALKTPDHRASTTKRALRATIFLERRCFQIEVHFVELSRDKIQHRFLTDRVRT
jgi:hypothetical protein